VVNCPLNKACQQQKQLRSLSFTKAFYDKQSLSSSRENNTTKTKAADSQCSSHVFFLLLFSKVAGRPSSKVAAEDQNFWAIETKKKMYVTLNTFFCASAPLTRKRGKRENF
jgi:hypothetical protein